MRTEAPAKLNLYLEVRGLRRDGYHEVATVLTEIGLSDVLEAEEDSGLSLDAGGIPIPLGGENLVLKAARLLAESAGVRRGARFSLLKRIPPGSGLGGGSSDAAAALKLLDRLWRLNVSREDLAAVAERVGSDVPFFLWGGTALCTGRGERVEPLPALAPFPVRLLWPGVPLPTAAVYGALVPEERIVQPGRLESFLSVLREGNPGRIFEACHNALEAPALRVMPELSNPGPGRDFRMTGSGSAFFSIGVREEEEKGSPQGPQQQEGWMAWDTST